MKLQTLIIDDEPDALDKLKSYIEKIPFLELAAACQGSTEALEFLANRQIDVIFTDIDMPDINGIAFVESLTTRTMVVFITAYRDFAVEGFRLSAIDYLVKPYSMAEFQRAANKVLEVYQNRHPRQKETQEGSDSLFVKVETHYERISQSAIRYIKGYAEYLQIFVDGQPRPVLTISSFANIAGKLNSSFLQVHRSYIVNMDRIVRIERNRIVMDKDIYIPVSNTYRDDFIRYLQTYSIGKLPK